MFRTHTYSTNPDGGVGERENLPGALRGRGFLRGKPRARSGGRAFEEGGTYEEC